MMVKEELYTEIERGRKWRWGFRFCFYNCKRFFEFLVFIVF